MDYVYGTALQILGNLIVVKGYALELVGDNEIIDGVGNPSRGGRFLAVVTGGLHFSLSAIQPLTEHVVP
jgi:hypothetical protein